MKGYFTVSYSYLTDSNLSDDLWTARMVAWTAAQSAERPHFQQGLSEFLV